MSTVRIYKSTDPEAPAHPSSTPGSLNALLRACLVTGYGTGANTKAPAGWEEPFPETNNSACFRALSGVRQFYQFLEAADADVGIARSYDSMSDAQTGVGPLRGDKYFGKWFSGSYLAYGWTVIADEKTCYVFLSSVAGVVAHAFGEFYSFLQQDPYKALLVGHGSSTYMTSGAGQQMMNGASNAYSASGRAEIHTVVPMSGYSSTTRGEGTIWSFVDSPSYSTNSQRGIASPSPGVAHPVHPLSFFSSERSGVHGRFRGIYIPAAFRPRAHMEVFSMDGKTMMALHTGAQDTTDVYKGEIWVDISGSWEESA